MKEWALSLRSAHKLSQELLGSMARKAGKIYGTERDASMKSSSVMINNNITSSTAATGGVGGGGGMSISNSGGSGGSSALNNQNITKTNGN